MAARTLLIHQWRRIALRDPGLPAALLPKDWAGEAARDQVRRIYARLLQDSEGRLDGAGLAVFRPAIYLTRCRTLLGQM